VLVLPFIPVITDAHANDNHNPVPLKADMTSIPVKNILIFDDDKDYRVLIRTFLEKYLEGVNVEEYDPVARGVPDDDFDWSAYDVIVLDYYLCIYGVTGLDLLHRNRTRPGFPAVVMLTGAADQDTAVNALDSGVSAFLRKEKLDKMELVEAIRSAAKEHGKIRLDQNNLEKESRSFDKAGFYRRLAKTGSRGEPDHVFLYLDVDDYPDHVRTHGIIVSANLLRHVAKLSFRFFQDRGKITNITRISDSSLGLLIDHPGKMAELNSILQELCNHLDGKEFIYQDRNIPFSVSIGAHILRQEAGNNDKLVMQLKQARNIARKTTGNSFYIITDADREKMNDSDITDLGAIRSSDHDLQIDQHKLDRQSREILEAFLDNRTLKWFHPVVSTSPMENGNSQIIMKMSAGIVDAGGKILEPDQLMKLIRSETLQQYVDRWKLKELLARIVGNEKSGSDINYMLDISEAWLADISLFNWLKDLLGKLCPLQPGKNLILAVSLDMLDRHSARANALLTSLEKTYKFRLALGGLNPGDLPSWSGIPIRFQYVITSATEMLDSPAFSDNPALLLKAVKTMKDQGMHLIVDGIENSTMLTDVISFGAEYVMGPFIDESQSEFSTMERIEAL